MLKVTLLRKLGKEKTSGRSAVLVALGSSKSGKLADAP